MSDEVDVTDVGGRSFPDGRPTYAVSRPRGTSARRLLHVDPREARPVVEVSDGDRDYDAVVDLLGSGPDAAEFVVESEEDGTAVLRFGDSTYGRRLTWTSLHGHLPARSRLDRQRRPRVRCGAASHRCRIRLGPQPAPCHRRHRPEPIDKAARMLRMPSGCRSAPSPRTTTAPSWRTAPDVQRAAGRTRWTALYTAFVTVDRIGGLQVDPGFAADVRTFLDGYWMAGVDGGVATSAGRTRTSSSRSSAWPDRFTTDVERDVLDVVSARVLPDGRRGSSTPTTSRSAHRST